MANLIITVVAEDGTPINGAYWTGGQYNTSPCPFGSFGCTSGAGGPWSPSDTGTTGQSITQIPFTCKQQWTGTLNASGFVTQLFAYSSGFVTGDCKYTVTMTANKGGPSSGNNKGGNTSAGDTGQQIKEGSNAALSTAGQNLSDWLSTYWWVVLLLGILLVAVIVALHHRGGGGAVTKTLNVTGASA